MPFVLLFSFAPSWISRTSTARQDQQIQDRALALKPRTCHVDTLHCNGTRDNQPCPLYVHSFGVLCEFMCAFLLCFFCIRVVTCPRCRFANWFGTSGQFHRAKHRQFMLNKNIGYQPNVRRFWCSLLSIINLLSNIFCFNSSSGILGPVQWGK